MPMNFEEISRITTLMCEHELTEFCLECDDFKLRLKRTSAQQAAVAASAPALAAVPDTPVSGPADEPSEPAVPETVVTIPSPIVGTFYAAPSPDVPPYVKPGDQVDDDTVVCIVEAMKVMNEIKAERCGVIRRVLVETASPVQFGQPLFEIDVL